MNCFKAVAILGSVFLAVCACADASDLGPPYIEGTVNDAVYIGASGGSVTGGATDNVTASAYYYAGTGSVSISQTSYSTGYNEIENASARVESAFEVLGAPNSTAEVVFSAIGSTSASADVGSTAVAYAWVGSSIDSSDLFEQAACSYVFYYCVNPDGGAPPTASSFNTKFSFSVATNTIYYLTIGVIGSSNAGGFTASVDPSVSFGLGFNSTGDTLVYSADETAMPVPELSACALAFVGLGTVACARRRTVRLPIAA